MDAKLGANRIMTEEDRSLTDAFKRERARLRSFIRRRVADPADAEDILQEVFYELVAAARLVRPVEQVGAWLFRVARNRITDLFRRKQVRRAVESPPTGAGDEDESPLEELLPSGRLGPEAAFARRLLLEGVDA